jgi:O6-methylguanine-DNA--protein-cysteine methyltransferase
MIGERHFETQALVDELKAIPPGELVTYEILAARCGVPVSTVRKRAQGAFKIALDEHVILETVRKVGIRRVPQ